MLKSNNRTHRKKLAEKAMRVVLRFFSPFLSLFLSSLGHDIDRMTNSKRTAKGKRGKVARLRPEHIGGGAEEDE